jgi:serine/threonine protein kinase
MALEYLLDGCFHMTSDVWSYGVVLWEMFSLGLEPYPGKEYENLLVMLQNGYTLPCPNDVENYVGDWNPKGFYDVISAECFNLDPSNRASFETLVRYIERHLTKNELLEYGNNINTGN